MKIKIIATGSNGNSYLVTTNKNKQLLIECGVKINDILRNVDLIQLEGCLISHYHNDHCLCADKIKRYSIPLFEPSNIEVAKKISLPSFNILPIESYHNVDCYGFIIHLKDENKKILFITDSTKIDPRLPDISYDLALIECNYSENYIKQNIAINNDQQGYENHMSYEYLNNWLKTRKFSPKSLCLIHLSNRGNLGLKTPLNDLKRYCGELFIGEKDLIMEI